MATIFSKYKITVIAQLAYNLCTNVTYNCRDGILQVIETMETILQHYVLKMAT